MKNKQEQEMKEISSSGIFSSFTEKNRIYVDKTEQIYSLVTKLDKIFISRPRRFGKSLTLDTIGTLFEKGVEPYFKNTWIYDRWKEPVCPVLRIDFLIYPKDSVEEFKRQFVMSISEFAQYYEVKGYKEDKEPGLSLRSLLNSLNREERYAVLILDEYDCQLSANINNEELYEKYRECICSIYAALKSAPAIRFMAVAGVTRLKDASIFSVGSDIRDISNESAYSQLIGFTRDEIRTYYIDYLKLAASYDNHISQSEVTSSQVEAVLDRMAEQYNGYCFDRYAKKTVFSTWSVNNFLQEVSQSSECHYGDYWYENGGLPSILVNYLNSHKLTSMDYLTEDGTIDVNYNLYMNPTTLKSMDQSVLMCQTGYLTLKSPLEPYSYVKLGVPNGEVKRALLIGLSNLCFTKLPQLSAEERELLDRGEVSSVIALFNAIMNSIVYDSYDVDCEGAVRNSLFLYLNGAKVDVRCESHSSKGRADLIIETPNRRTVVELKHTDSETDVKDRLSEAAAQIKERDYGNTAPLKELVRIAAVFNSDPKVRSFTFEKV